MGKRFINGKSGRGRFAQGHAGALAIREQALSIYWEWCFGDENFIAGSSSVVCIDGPLEKKSTWFDGYDCIVERFKAACTDVDTTSVILKFDSPGGACSGLYDCVAEMKAIAAKSKKRIVAVADDCAFSAAYALSCVASEIYLGRSSFAGSVGVLCVVADTVGWNEQHGINVVVVHAGEKKVYGHPDVPLSDDAIASFQVEVDQLATMFYELVSEARGMTTDDVAALQAGTFMGEDAVAAGLADGVMTFDQVVAMLANDAKQSAAMATENGDESMGGKAKTGYKTAAESGATDAFATPQVAPVNMQAMTAIAGALGAGQLPAAAAAEEEENSTEDEETYEGEDSGDESEATNSDEEEAAAEGDDSEEGDDSDDDEESDDSEASLEMPKIAASSTSADVLKAVREMTGQTGAAAQLGALYALQAKAAKADKVIADAKKAAKAARKSTLASMVEKAISAGQLAPSQRNWAMGCSVEGLKAFLKDAPKALVKRAPTAHGTPIKTKQATKTKTAMDQALSAVARATGQDPKALAAHADELKAKGIIH
jgi:ClpP class serine protease